MSVPLIKGLSIFQGLPEKNQVNQTSRVNSAISKAKGETKDHACPVFQATEE